MNQQQYIDFMNWLDTPASAVKPFEQLSGEQRSTLVSSLAYQRFKIKQASDEFSKAVRNSVLGRFPFLRP